VHIVEVVATFGGGVAVGFWFAKRVYSKIVPIVAPVVKAVEDATKKV